MPVLRRIGQTMSRGGARKGAGRKATGRNKKPQAAVVLTAEQKQWVEEAAKKEGCSVSVLILKSLVSFVMGK